MSGFIELLGKLGLGEILSGLTIQTVKYLFNGRNEKKQFYKETSKIVNRCVDDTYEMCPKIEYVPKDEKAYNADMVKKYNNFVSIFNDLSELIKDNSAFYYSEEEKKYLMAIVRSCKFIGMVFAEEYVFHDPKNPTVDNKKWYKVLNEQNHIKENKAKLQVSIERRFKKRRS